MENIIIALSSLEGVKVIELTQGAVEIHLQSPKDMSSAFRVISKALTDPEDSPDDIQITTNFTRGIIYIDPFDREEYDDEEEDY